MKIKVLKILLKICLFVLLYVVIYFSIEEIRIAKLNREDAAWMEQHKNDYSAKRSVKIDTIKHKQNAKIQ